MRSVILRVLRVLLCLAAALPTALASPAAAQDLTQPLTAAEVECSELQLGRLLARFDVFVPRPPASWIGNLLLAPGDGEPSYQGLLATIPAPAAGLTGPERQLAFHLQPVRSLLLNPGRPPLGQVSLTREEPASSLVPRTSSDAAGVVLEPGLTRPDPRLRMSIDNVVEPDGLATSTRPGRGLERDGLLTPCTGRLTAFDRHVFALLQRMVRAETRFFAGSSFIDTESEIAVFRGADPHVYRLNVYGGGVAGKVAVEVEIGWTPDGRLTTAGLRILPVCPNLQPGPGCTDKFAVKPIETRIWLVPPAFGGVQAWQRDVPDAAQLFHSTHAAWIDADTADFTALLADTAWNGGF